MNISTLLLSIVIICLIAAGLVFAGANLSSKQITDTYGNAPTAETNTTTQLVENVTYVGTTASSGIILVIACLVVLGGVGLVWAYGKSK